MGLRYLLNFAGVTAITFAIAISATGQTNRSQVSGTISAVDAAGNHVSLKSDKGEAIDVTTTDRTLVLRIPPGETDPKKGSKVALSSLSAGDRAVVVGPAPSGNSWNATALLVMTSTDVASLHAKDAEEWSKRGAGGTVTAVDAGAKTIALKSGARALTVHLTPATTYRRYSPDSARFADAKSSSLEEVKSGDQLRVLGNKSDDGANIDAEKIVFGTFRQIAATISSVDAAKNELTVKDLSNKKTLVIRTSADSTMRRMPEQMAQMMARRYSPAAQAAAAEGGGRGEGAGRGGRGQGDVSGMLDRLPPVPLSELKAGDAIMVSTTQGTDSGPVTAIMLLAGVEPLLTASPNATRDIMSGWNLGGGGGDSGQ